MQLDLFVWGDDTIRLAYWDDLEGKDRVFVLNADGTASEAELDVADNTIEKVTPVDLIAALREMAQKDNEAQ